MTCDLVLGEALGPLVNKVMLPRSLRRGFPTPHSRYRSGMTELLLHLRQEKQEDEVFKQLNAFDVKDRPGF